MRTRLMHVVIAATAVALVVAMASSKSVGSAPVKPSVSTLRSAAAFKSVEANGYDGTAYPRGRWRLSPPALRNVRLSFSVILLRYQGAALPDVGALRRVYLPEATRTKEEARKLSAQLAIALASDPDSFAAAARTRSDDVASAPRGGRLGVVPANQLPFEFLDALQALSVGAVSHAIETPAGFYVIRKLAVEPERSLAWRQITYAFEGSDPGVLRPGLMRVERTRDEALRMAAAAVERLKGAPDAFASIAESESDHYSATRGGYSGLWSIHEPEIRNLELDVLSTMNVGEVSLLETTEGIRIVQRAEPAETWRYAAEYVFFGFDRDAAENSSASRAIAENEAARTASSVGRRPESFAKLRGRRIVEWTTARGPAGLEEAIAGTAMGSVCAGYAISSHGFFVARRVEPLDQKQTLAFELPEPRTPDLEYLVQTMPGSVLAGVVRNIEAQANTKLLLSKTPVFSQSFEELAAELAEATPPDRMVAVSTTFAALKAQLGDERFRQLDDLVSRHVEGALLATSR